jgi:hypothetical protein
MADATTDQFYAGEAIHGYGAQLEVGQGDSPESFVAVADVMSITPGDMTTAVIDKTHLRSPEAHREKLAGIRDSGPFVLKGNWRPKHGTQSNATNTTADGVAAGRGLIALWRNRTEANFKIVLNDVVGGSPAEQLEWPFRGVVTKFQPGEIGVDSKIDFTCEITPLQDFSADLP